MPRPSVGVREGGATNPNDVNALLGTVLKANAEPGVFATLQSVTPGMDKVVDKSGTYVNEATGQTYRRIQVMTVADLIAEAAEVADRDPALRQGRARGRDQLALDVG